MKITDAQVAALHAQLAGQSEKHRRLLGRLDREEANTGYAALVAAAFFEAAERHFIRDGKIASKAEVIDFVASVRARTDKAVDTVDPDIAEQLIFQVIGLESNPDVQNFDHNTAFRTQIVLMAALVGEARFSDSELDAFMAKIRSDADELTR